MNADNLPPPLPALTDLRTIEFNGSMCQVARLPVEPSIYLSNWVAYNGNAQEYEIRFRFSQSLAEHYGLPA